MARKKKEPTTTPVEEEICILAEEPEHNLPSGNFPEPEPVLPTETRLLELERLVQQLHLRLAALEETHHAKAQEEALAHEHRGFVHLQY